MSVVKQFQQLEAHASRLIIGQAHLINRMLIALLCDGHLLVEGPPGLAKTRAIKVLAESIEGDFHRVQFTPDLLPADLTGTDIYRPQEGTFEFRKGPLFHNLILADEINRAPAKVQSALLEAMEERQITVGDRSYTLDDLFMVMATQNPIEQEGTYPLPESQLDRFLMHAQVDYPTTEDERRILVLNRDEAKANERDAFQPSEMLSVASIMQARQDILNLHLADELEEYIVNIVVATRNPGAVNDALNGQILYGASPRASMGYEGHLLKVPDLAEKESRIAEAIGFLNATKIDMERAGLPCPIVSAGGTGSYLYTARQPGLTEIQAGGGIFMDLMYRNHCKVPDLEFALTILATVTSRPAPQRAIIDAGRKTMNQELHVPEFAGRDDLEIKYLSAEHGFVAVKEGPGPAIGERLEILPGYCDFTTVLHDHFYCFRGERLEAIWPLEARGCLT